MTTATLPDRRLEIKFVAHAWLKEDLLNWIRVHPDGFVVPYPDRHVNNVYFDNYDYRAFAENLSGASERTKLRYRWYGDAQGPDSGYLEVKKKRNRFGWKNRFRVAEPPYSTGNSWNRIRAHIRAQLPMAGRAWLDMNPLPVLLNRYTRHYFRTADGSVRATVDSDQKLWDQRFHAFPNFTRATPLDDTVVVEFKFSPEMQEKAARLVRGIPVRVSRHSKYMNGVRAISMR